MVGSAWPPAGRSHPKEMAGGFGGGQLAPNLMMPQVLTLHNHLWLLITK